MPVVLALALIVAISMAYGVYQRYPVPKPPIEISKLSIEPSPVKEGEKSILIVSVKNLDLKTHEIKFIFDVGPRVLMYAGAEQLLPKSNSFYVYTFTLEAADPAEERVFAVTTTLEEGISSADYTLSLMVFIDGEELRKTWDDLALTVRK